MVFNSHIFLVVFLPLVWLGYWFVLPSKMSRQLFLLAASLFFYALAGVSYLLLLIVTAGVTFVAARYFLSSQQPSRRKIGLILGFSSLAILVFFKYSGTLGRYADVWGLSSLDPLFDLALPLGISFYTFNLLGYILDVYRGQIQAATSPLQFLTYISFFPTISSGPLVRYRVFNEQLNASLDQQRPTVSAIEQGSFSIAIGLSKKLIIADYLASQIDPLLANYGQLEFWGAWIVILAYTYQLYFDFSGYTDIAIGVGLLLGFKLPVNFNAPYTARNITEFWQRWHITLSTWFRENLFFPMSRFLLKRSPVRSIDATRTIAQIVTMMLIGWWHGAQWPFVLWGVYHGAMLALHAQSRASHWRAVPPLVARAMTFLAVIVGWVMFRSESLDMMTSLYTSMVGLHGFGAGELADGNLGANLALWLGVLFVITNLSRDTFDLKPRLGWGYAVATAVLLVLCLLMIGESESFLYFQF